MAFGNPLTLLRVRHFAAQAQLTRDLNAYYRLHFLHAASECGLLQVLKSPAARQQIAEKLGVKRPELLDALLELGLSLGELSLQDGHYRLKGACSRALAARDGDPLVAFVQEAVAYHGSVFRALPERLRGAPLGDYLSTLGGLVARSSRVLEPLMLPFLRAALDSNGPIRLLEIGCGSGIYLRHAAEINPSVTGIGIDLQEAAARQARSNLQAWGLERRFSVLVADVRQPPGELTGPFDLITLYNNVYYFEPGDRTALLRSLRARLAPRGRLAVVSLMQARNVTAAAFDLVLQSTLGCAPLPRLDDLISQVREAGFEHADSRRLAPLTSIYGVLASS